MMSNSQNDSNEHILDEKTILPDHQQSGSCDHLPNNVIPLDNQVAGHFYSSNRRFGLLKHNPSGDILKPIVDTRSKRECAFYSTVWQAENDNDASVVKLRQFIPRYNGIFEDDKTHYIKIGLKTYDQEASEEKIKCEMSKYLYAQQLGFRILGMRIYQNEEKKYLIKDKDFGKQLKPEDIEKELLQFVGGDLSLLKSYCERLNVIKEWFEKDNVGKWNFISSSLLFVHNQNDSSSAIIKMIDFAHVFPNTSGLDHNYIFGLNKLKEYFDLLHLSVNESCVN